MNGSTDANCAYKDVWTGQQSDGATADGGISAQLDHPSKPTHLRFTDDDTLTFNVEYERLVDGRFRAATYAASVNDAPLHKLGLLSMGDSYISGEGEFAYREGTDTDNDRCHNSPLSYPYIVGINFNTFNSVACSGAITDDIENSSTNYTGQVKDGLKQYDREDKQSIMANFIPGYLNQNQFVSTYAPQAVVLSIGGNDIGFSDIIQKCVANSDGNTCYDSYQDRAELARLIDSKYDVLRQTYESIRQASPGVRLYVIGYPQIAQPNGSCALNVHLNNEEILFSNQLIAYLDTTISEAATSAGALYVDVQDAFDGHRLCESGEKAVNGLTAGGDASVSVLGKDFYLFGSESYHPTQLGHRLLAAAIEAETNNLTSAMPASSDEQPSSGTDSVLLRGYSVTGDGLPDVIHVDDSIAPDLLMRGQTNILNLHDTSVQLEPGSTYQIMLHSTPLQIGSGIVSTGGAIGTAFTVPTNAAAGIHSLQIMAHNIAGQTVMIEKTVYVATSATDYDGDGLANNADSCTSIVNTDIDVDKDGIDDACDPIVKYDSNTKAVNVSGVISTTVTATSATKIVSSVSPTVVSQASGYDATDGSPAVLRVSQTVGDDHEAATNNRTSHYTNTHHSNLRTQYVLVFAGAFLFVGIFKYVRTKLFS